MAKVFRLDVLLTLTVLRRALAGGYDAVHLARRRRIIGVVVAAAPCGSQHLYDMQLEPAQQLTNFAFTVAGRSHGVFGHRALMISSLARRHRHLTVARGDRPRHRAPARTILHRETRQVSAEKCATPTRASVPCAGRSDLGEQAPIVLYRRERSSVPGPRLALDR
jgi:hypothetical protein